MTVDNTSYALIDVSLSDKGIIVAVVNLEPLRCAMDLNGNDFRDTLRIMYKVIERSSIVLSRRISEWALGDTPWDQT